MKFIIGNDRSRIPIFTSTLEEAIDQNNEVRLIDLFVQSLQLADYGFKSHFIDNGRPAYHPGDLLRLFIYGYSNRIRSSRQLEKECRRNIELMWLLKGLVPDHNTIANFRKDNPKAIAKVFRSTVQLAKHFNLIGGRLIAGDSTKMRAQNSKKNSFNQKEIERHIAYIDGKLQEYSGILTNQNGDPETGTEVKEKIKKQLQQKDKYNQMQEGLDQSGEVQISISDPDSRQLTTRNNITEVAYNVQANVDAKNKISIEFKVTNKNDSKAMGNMVLRAKTILGTSAFTALYDKGYHTGTEFDYAHRHGVEVIVAIPDVASHAPDLSFDVEHFTYSKEQDLYICPAGETLTTNERWYNKASGKTINMVKHYKTKACITCLLFEKCTQNKAGRLIERSEHMDLIDANKQRMVQNLDVCRKRQAIVEHPFGTMKRQWDFYYIMTKKTMEHASADVGLIFTCYNLPHIFNLIDQNELKKWLRRLLHCTFLLLKSHFKLFKPTFTTLLFPHLFSKQCATPLLKVISLTPIKPISN